VLEASQIRRYYLQAFREQDYHKEWEGIWSKQYKIRLADGGFLNLNKLLPRLSFNSLKRFLIQFTPVHVYQSVLNWLRLDQVSLKSKSQAAPSLTSEYIVDVDSYLRYKLHPHFTEAEGICYGCLQIAKELTEEILDVVEENYNDVRIVFSGHRGYHIHVLDFDVRDFTIYLHKHPLKSHEVARFLYTEQLKERAPDCFEGAHFISSSDITRVITFPDSLNCETGLVASYLGDSNQFRNLSVEEIIEKARSKKHITEGSNRTPPHTNFIITSI
jgi:hypothetical protein